MYIHTAICILQYIIASDCVWANWGTHRGSLALSPYLGRQPGWALELLIMSSSVSTSLCAQEVPARSRKCTTPKMRCTEHSNY